jgi:hypothetical protein
VEEAAMNRRTLIAARWIRLAALIPALALLLPVGQSAPSGTCLLCIWEDLRQWLFAAFLAFGGLVAAILTAIVPDAFEEAFFERLHSVTGPMYDLFCDFGEWIDSILPDSWTDPRGTQGGTYPGYY